ncbi:MAG: hypothetical protein OXB98_23050 [Bryobacterales bacterium]|nr:hypothetical protein [Bryobacterales bacterium]
MHQIRERCAQVAEQARFVRIRGERIPDYAASLLMEEAGPAELDPAYHYVGHGPATLAFILTLDAVNFGSGYFPGLRKRRGLSGYFTVASSLNDYFGEFGPISPDTLAELSTESCNALFGQERENETAFELMGLFASALNDLGRLLIERFEGSFVRLVDSAEQSAEKLVQILEVMPFYRDVHQYGDLEVPFYKRAQLTAADLALVFGHEGPGLFEDMDRLTIFADNLVPHVLRTDGLIEYDAHLIDRIARGELIASESLEEIEIRASAVTVVERIREEITRRGGSVTSMELDYRLWNRGQGASYKALPRHRCRCVFY